MRFNVCPQVAFPNQETEVNNLQKEKCLVKPIQSFGPECDVYPSGNLQISLIQMESDAKRTHCVFFKNFAF